MKLSKVYGGMRAFLGTGMVHGTLENQLWWNTPQASSVGFRIGQFLKYRICYKLRRI